MSEEKELVKKISKLSRLSVEEEKIDSFVKNFSEILSYIELLNLASEDQLEKNNITNPDYAKRDDDSISKLDVDEVLKNAPRKDGNFFLVKKVIDEE
ncbi:MAG: Asp-tRNA(Asn)/Glu-tRNA(Gln) amidotransferase subunit GatC [Thermodesulfobacteriota bacterium]|nr:Asp-tRNA(Asn)/Glu-tRNA(Gln) amidotransferase subunit GatC [Thermodesulfobacteriota bacterium]MEE2975369.1 Asp-tRNA(Asn)/Glu-tRNA(Gln) amidotransferase subunit GatC [Thermodesulfobacteriota bacterium]|tara:strand:+ start:96 stop:386 length:291 start_codon:yes stop_codon:yes gene_type:complete